jgi:hypothetical protein
MTPRKVPFILLVATVGFLGATTVPAWAESADPVALAAAIVNGGGKPGHMPAPESGQFRAVFSDGRVWVSALARALPI